MDRHVQRRQALGHHPFQVGLGEARERREVPIEEGEAIVVVLHVQAAPHATRQLMDEAELAVVVARADPIEHRRVDLDAERRSRRLVEVELELKARPIDHERHLGLVGQHPELDDVADRHAVDGEQHVADPKAGEVGGAVRDDADDARCGHGR